MRPGQWRLVSGLSWKHRVEEAAEMREDRRRDWLLLCSQ